MRSKRIASMLGVTAASALLFTGLVAADADVSTSPGLSTALPKADADDIKTPEQYFGFEMGAEGKLAEYPKVLDYMKSIAEKSDRVTYDTVGETTEGNEYATVAISSPDNLDRLDEIVEMNKKLSDPRNTSSEEARKLAKKSVPVYHLEATVHSTEVSNGQAINDIVHRLATEDSKFTEKILTNSVILLVPSQNPDGQHKVVGHFNDTAGTDKARVYPDLYHKYTGHDDNRDWLMFSQIESRYRLNLIKKFNPAMVHIMHQKGNQGSRIFVPPYGGLTSGNVPANMNSSTSALGQHAERQLMAEGKRGVSHAGNEFNIFWTLEQPVGFFPFRGAGVFLTEIATGKDLAYPQESDDGSPLGPQQSRQNLIKPYKKNTWTLKQQVEYGKTATYAGMEYVAQNHEKLLYYNLFASANSYTKNGVESGSYAFVIPADQRDDYATYELLKRLEMTEVEIHQATAPFKAAGNGYQKGSYVIQLHQPRGNWAHQVLGVDKYPQDEELPYAEATSNMPMWLGVEADEIDSEFDADLTRVDEVEVPDVKMPEAPGEDGAYFVSPESYGTIEIVTALQDKNIRTFRSASSFRRAGQEFPAGTFVIPATPQARSVLQKSSEKVGLEVYAAASAPKIEGVQLKPNTRVGLFRGANNMPGGWDKWIFDHYGINYKDVGAQDFQHDSLNELYDTIVLPNGISKKDIVEGLDKDKYGSKYSWAYGVGEKGWKKLRKFVRDGGTLLATGSSVETAKELMHLGAIEKALPEGRGSQDKFATGGSLIKQEFDTSEPVAWGMPKSWPIWLYRTQAWDVKKKGVDVASSYPEQGELLASGFLRGDQYLRGAGNAMSFDRGEGKVIVIGNEPTFRSLPRVTFTMVFNAIYGGPAADVKPQQLTKLQKQFTKSGKELNK